MKHLGVFLLQVIHLWFEDFALEDTQLCMRDLITLQDSLGIIGKSGIKSDLMGKGSSAAIQLPAFKPLRTESLFNCLFLSAAGLHANVPCAVCR